MSNIRGADTKPEMFVRKSLWNYGYRYRINDSRLPGKPDIVLPKYKTVIFVNGCFWHGHEGCRKATLPKTNAEFWKEKILLNKRRDERTITELKSNTWKVIVVWECELSTREKRDLAISRIIHELHQ